MTRSNHPPASELRLLARGEASEPAVRAHVDGCAECREELLLIEAAVSASAGCPPAIELVRHADGRLESARREAVDAHLTSCAACALAAEVARDSVSVRAQSTGPRERPWQRLARVLRELAQVEPAPRLVPALRGGDAGGLEAVRSALEAGEIDKALKELRSRGEGAPVALRLQLGRMLLEAGRSDEAVKELEAAASEAPKVAELRWHLAQALLLEGRGPDALEQLDRCAKLPSDRRDAARTLATAVRDALGEEP